MPESTHPVQIGLQRRDKKARISKAVTMSAYEVYCHVFAPKKQS